MVRFKDKVGDTRFPREMDSFVKALGAVAELEGFGLDCWGDDTSLKRLVCSELCFPPEIPDMKLAMIYQVWSGNYPEEMEGLSEKAKKYLPMFEHLKGAQTKRAELEGVLGIVEYVKGHLQEQMEHLNNE